MCKIVFTIRSHEELYIFHNNHHHHHHWSHCNCLWEVLEVLMRIGSGENPLEVITSCNLLLSLPSRLALKPGIIIFAIITIVAIIMVTRLSVQHLLSLPTF